MKWAGVCGMGNILVIDDHNDFRIMLAGILADAGYDVLEASDGEEGIKVYQENSVSLVIVDIIMPVKGGVETIFELRRMSPDLKIIAVSGGGRMAPSGLLGMAKSIGVHIFIKPFDMEQMLASIKQLLNEDAGETCKDASETYG
jgi:DNA-binding response OmpR family regulator